MTTSMAELRALTAERTIRDLLSLLSLSTLWIGRDGAYVIEQMLEAVERLMPLDVAIVEVPLNSGDKASFYGRVQGRAISGLEHEAWREATGQWQSMAVGQAVAARVCSTPIGALRVAKLDLVMTSHSGKLWFGSFVEGFPSNTQLALFRAAASLAATGLQTARTHYEREQASRQKDEFLALLGHELRNPLAPIRSTAALLRYDGASRDQVRLAGDVIERQVRHMTALVDDLLDVSRLSTGTIVLNMAAVSLREVLNQAVEQVRPSLEAKRHYFSANIEECGLYVLGDFNRLVQVACNLLSNAVKYTPDNGKISLHTSVDANLVKIAVSDDGIGIDPDALPKIFALFMQVQRSADRSDGGLGVGLALTKRLVELHNGTLIAESAGLGLGAKFVVTLPVTTPALNAGERKGSIQLTKSKHALRVMVVDDNVDAADTLAAMLDAMGHEAHTFYHPNEALVEAPVVQPDAFVLDIGLPDMDGYALAQRLRSIPELKASKLVALTGFGLPNDRRDAQVAGFDHHCVKPVDIATLSAILEQIAVSKG